MPSVRACAKSDGDWRSRSAPQRRDRTQRISPLRGRAQSAPTRCRWRPRRLIRACPACPPSGALARLVAMPFAERKPNAGSPDAKAKSSPQGWMSMIVVLDAATSAFWRRPSPSKRRRNRRHSPWNSDCALPPATSVAPRRDQATSERSPLSTSPVCALASGSRLARRGSTPSAAHRHSRPPHAHRKNRSKRHTVLCRRERQAWPSI